MQNTYTLIDVIATMKYSVPVTVLLALAQYILMVSILPMLKNKKNVLTVILCHLIATLLISIVSIPFFNFFQNETMLEVCVIISEFLMNLIANICVVLMYYKRVNNVAKLVSAISVTSFFANNLMYSLSILLDPLLQYATSTIQYNLFFFASRFLIIFLSWGLSVILQKVKFHECFHSFFGTSKLQDILFVIISSFLLFSSLILILTMMNGSTWIIVLILLFSIVMFLALTLFSWHWNQKMERLKIQENIIIQQRNYVEMLEGLQREMRFMKHDFKNMMAGLYLQAEQGDTSGMQTYLKSALGYLDKKIGTELRQTTQFTNIKILELQSLMMLKISKMKDCGIDCILEIRNPIVSLPIRIEDFLRCIGILLDNAIEAADEVEEAKIIILLLQEENLLSVLIKNSTIESKSIYKLRQEGYSSKGKKRGFGLASYHHILENYENVLTRTSHQNGMFLQEMILSR